MEASFYDPLGEVVTQLALSFEDTKLLFAKLDAMSLLFRSVRMLNAQKDLYVRVLLASEDAPTVVQLVGTLDHLMTWWEGSRFPLPGHILRTRRHLLEEGSL